MEDMNSSPLRVLLISCDYGLWDAEKSLKELTSLAESAGYEVAAAMCQKREAPDNANYLGEGRLSEAGYIIENDDIDFCIFDDELTGVQLKNTEAILGVPVIDRTMLILEIFDNRAVTKEGKYQTELARLQYKLPRLIGMGDVLSRQGGGGAGGGGARRGSGESKLEYDRRYLRERIDHLKRKLQELSRQRAVTRKSRQKNGVPVVALVGYTNVGKSSLLNRLTQSSILAEDMLFATLDPTARKYELPNGLDIILVDTVGFVSRLPHNLVEAFKSTLEEASYADLILKVCDAGDSESDMQLKITDEVLQSLGCDKIPQITVYNKCDLENCLLWNRQALPVSAKTGRGLNELIEKIQEALSAKMTGIEALLPYTMTSLASKAHESGKVLKEDYREDGIYLKALVRIEDAHLFTPYLYSIDK